MMLQNTGSVLSIAFVLAIVTAAVPTKVLLSIFSGVTSGLSDAALAPFIHNMHVALWVLAATSLARRRRLAAAPEPRRGAARTRRRQSAIETPTALRIGEVAELVGHHPPHDPLLRGDRAAADGGEPREPGRHRLYDEPDVERLREAHAAEGAAGRQPRRAQASCSRPRTRRAALRDEWHARHPERAPPPRDPRPGAGPTSSASSRCSRAGAPRSSASSASWHERQALSSAASARSSADASRRAMSLTRRPRTALRLSRATPNFAHRRPAAPAAGSPPLPRRVRGELGGDGRHRHQRAFLLHETGLKPQLYVPLDDVAPTRWTRTDHATYCPFKGDASYRSIRAGDRVAENALWVYDEPIEQAAWLRGLAGVYVDRLDRWLDEDDEVRGFTDPYHRIDVRRTSRRVQVRARGDVIADTEDALVLSETALANRYYLPPAAVAATLHGPTAKTTYCPYKGTASYSTVELADGTCLEDAAWSYHEPYGESGRSPACCRSGARTSRSSSTASACRPSGRRSPQTSLISA